MKVPAEQRATMLASYQSRDGVEGALAILAELELANDLREQVIEDTLKGAPAAKAYWTDRGMIENISALIGLIDIPSLVIVGDADRVENEATLRKGLGPILTDCAFRVLPGVGHLSPLEAPDAVASALRQFLSL